jgi:DnaK suppressor protein
MNAKDLEYFKYLIQMKREEVMQSVDQMEFNAKDNFKDRRQEDNRYATHIADQGSDTMTKELNSYFNTRVKKYLKYLNEALQRLENGTYGICVDCGEKIPRERLEEVPHTRYCVPCKTK